MKLLAILLILLIGWGNRSVAAEERHLTFEQDVWPILKAHCFDCHGATEMLEGSLDLRQVRRMQSGGESGAAIVISDSEQSLLFQRVRDGDMPPGEAKVSAAELETLQKWIDGGAATKRPESENIGPGLGITPEERDFWSFRPIRRPDLKLPTDPLAAAAARTQIDALALAASAADEPLEEADRRTLVMRAYFTLTGLPPTFAQAQSWLADQGDDWFDRLLDELLQSPQYGEQWGRHWLDVAGYADSEGFTVNDAIRPWAWKYRDYVIRSLNQDKPFDQFIAEQLAGDELAGARQGDWTPDQIEFLTATGFLRMAADGTGSGENTEEARNQTIADTLRIVGTSLMGLSFHCAQCHDHRYDPILHTDYFALRAVFEPALDWQSWKPPAARLVSLQTESDRARAAEIEAEAQVVAKEKADKQGEYMLQALEQELAKFDEPLREPLRTAYQTPAAERSEQQKELLATNPSVNITPGVLYQYLPKAAEELKTFDQRIAEIRSRKPPEEFVRALVEPPGHAPETKLFHRGDHQQPKQTVLPAAPTVAVPEGERIEFPLDDESLPTTGRRLALAHWLTSPGNPLTARVIVNRVWMHHFGTGLVPTPADFGKLGGSPSHPELLDWLADEFIREGWSLKKLQRLIMTSAVWRQVRGVEPVDANGLPSTLHRLEAETIRDRMLAATGALNRQLFGPAIAIKEDETGQVIVDGTQTRRSLYVQVRRSRPVAMLQAFDAPVMETNCELRPNSTVATQSLMLLNGEFILDQAAKLAERAIDESGALEPPFTELVLDLPSPPAPQWGYGFGYFDEVTGRTESFEPLTHWTGSQWQSGPALPDPNFGWVLLTAAGGHPDGPDRAVIRRWTAARDSTVVIRGKLSHGSPNGDGVRGRIISSRSGNAGEWVAHNGEAETNVIESLAVSAGDTIDFITDCRENQTSDSFAWPVTLTVRSEDAPERVVTSNDGFSGPQATERFEADWIVAAWRAAYSRNPTDEELQLAADFLGRQLDTLHQNPTSVPSGRTATRQALINLCQVLLSSNEFLYVD